MSSISSYDIHTCVPGHESLAKAPDAVDAMASPCMPCAAEVCNAKNKLSIHHNQNKNINTYMDMYHLGSSWLYITVILGIETSLLVA